MPLRYLFLILLCLITTPSESATLSFSGSLKPGTAVLLHIEGFIAGSKLQGKLDGRTFPISQEGFALLALDMETKQKKSKLRVQINPPKGKRKILTHTFSVDPRHYKEEHIDLPKKKVDLNPKDLKRANKETKAIRATYTLRSQKIGFEEGFQQPVMGRFSGVFGSRRVLNGKPRRSHNGVDIAAPKGTPVIATAPAKVALVGKDYFFTGNTVVLDHGHGVISLYSHLDTMLVKKNAWIPEGTVIGTIGMTGRATGPHLHWGMLVRHARVDPMLLPGIKTSYSNTAFNR